MSSRAGVWLGVLLGLAVGNLSAAAVVERVWGPAVKELQAAASLQDVRNRQPAVRRALEIGLLEADQKTRDEVFAFLSEASRWIDLRPYSDVIEEFSRTDVRRRGRWLLDDNELAHSPREERLAVYRRAIESGQTKLTRGSPLDRFGAMQAAVLDGMAELAPLIEQRYTDLSPELQARATVGQWLDTLELTSGGPSREDAFRLAADRLAALDENDFVLKMEGSEAFRRAVLQVAEYVCAKDSLTGKRNPGCRSVKEVIDRQGRLETKRAGVASSTSATGVASRQAEPQWLDQLRERAPL